MATNTPRLNLRKPGASDNIDVTADLDANFDILDNAAMVNVVNNFTAQTNNFGRGSSGAAQGFVQLGDDGAGNGLVIAKHGTAVDVNMALRSKGAGQTLLQDGNGNSQVLVGSNTLGFYGHAPIAISTITGAKAGNVALANLLIALAACGLIIDNTA